MLHVKALPEILSKASTIERGVARLLTELPRPGEPAAPPTTSANAGTIRSVSFRVFDDQRQLEVNRCTPVRVVVGPDPAPVF